jgi:integrase
MAQQAKPRKTRESFGAIRVLPSKRLQASYVGLDGVRYNAPHTFDTKTDARGWLSVQQAKLHTGQWSAMDAARADTAKKSSADTLSTYANEWLGTRMNRHGEHLRPRTRVEYKRLLDTTLLPLADERLKALTPEVIRKWYADQTADGKRTQAARAYGLLKAVLTTAVDDGKLTVNPCMIRGGQNATTGKEVKPPTAEQLRAILDNITPRYRAAVIIAAWVGCRYGEMTELRRKDILVTMDGASVVSVIVNVSRAVTKTTGEGFLVGKTKSEAGVRSIVLPPHVQQIVVDHLATLPAGQNTLLFPAADGSSHLAQSSFAKHWYPARKAAGRSDMPWHALRHHGATRAALAGATLKELQERLGHSTVAAAMRYQHTAGRDAELAKRMSELAEA